MKRSELELYDITATLRKLNECLPYIKKHLINLHDEISELLTNPEECLSMKFKSKEENLDTAKKVFIKPSNEADQLRQHLYNDFIIVVDELVERIDNYKRYKKDECMDEEEVKND